MSSTIQYKLDLDSRGWEKNVANAEKSFGSFTKGVAGSTAKVGAFADTVGRASTTLARSADAFGLPTQALRTLDDVMDVAELGFSNLSKAAVGFNAASVGVVGAGLAVGTAIGTWLNTFPAVQKAADSLTQSLLFLATSQKELDSIKTGFSAEEAAKIQESHQRTTQQLLDQVKAQHAAGESVEDLKKKYGEARPELEKLYESMREGDKAQIKAKESALDLAKAWKAAANSIDALEAKTSTFVMPDMPAPSWMAGMASGPGASGGTDDGVRIAEARAQNAADAIKQQGELNKKAAESVVLTVNWSEALENVANTFQTLAATGGPLGGILSLLGQAANMAASIPAHLATFKAGKGQGGLGGILGMATGGLGIVGSVIGFIGGIFGSGKKKAEELKKKQDEAMKSFADMFDDWEKARSELAAKGAAGVNGLVGSLFGEDGALVNDFTSAANAAEYVAATFAMLRQSGMSTAQALKAIGPALDAMRKDPAFAGGAAGPLVQMANFAEANAPLLQFIEGLGTTANALSGFGLLTQDLATKISVDMGAAIDRMVAAGLPYQQALALSAQDLYNLQQAAQHSGVALDEHTQQMINDAESAGLFEGLEDPMKKLVELNGAMVAAMGEVVKLMGGALPASIQKLIDEFNAANVSGPPPTTTGGTTTGGENGSSPKDQYADGGPVRRTGPALVHKGEYVIPAKVWKGMSQGGGMGGTSITVNVPAGANTAAVRKAAEEGVRAALVRGTNGPLRTAVTNTGR